MSSKYYSEDSTTDEDSELPSTEGEDNIISKIDEKYNLLEIIVEIINSSLAKVPVLIPKFNKIGCYILNPLNLYIKPLEKKEIRTGLSIKIPSHKYIRHVKIYPLLLQINIKMTYYFDDIDTDELVIIIENTDKLYEKRLSENQIIAEYWIKKRLNKKIELIIENKYLLN